jgi:hypothetical protein
MKTGKIYWGIEKIGEKERQREKRLEERDKWHWWREKAWVDFDHWLKTTPEYF